MKRGTAKPFETLTPEECIRIPVWEMALDGDADDDPERDESWRRPLEGVVNVTPEMGHVYCTLRVLGTELIATALLDPAAEALYEILIWVNGEWETPKRVPGLPNPVRYECVCLVDGATHAIYCSERAPRNYEAVRESADAT